MSERYDVHAWFWEGSDLNHLREYFSKSQAKGSKIQIYFELSDVRNVVELKKLLENIDSVVEVEVNRTFEEIYGKRVIVVGGGAQVSQVVLGAVSEADRHNLRGERISVDTIPLAGEEKIAEAVNAVGRLFTELPYLFLQALSWEVK